jgi:hypothetical protein
MVGKEPEMSAAVFAQRRGRTPNAEDYAEIQQLSAECNWTSDLRAEGGAPCVRLFTPDGEWELVGANLKVKGHEQLVRHAIAATEKLLVHHAPHRYATNVSIEASPEGGRGRMCGFIVVGQAGKPATITSTLKGSDVLMKRPGGWKFKSRKVHLGILSTDVSAP